MSKAKQNRKGIGTSRVNMFYSKPFIEVMNDYYEEAETPGGIGKRYIDAYIHDGEDGGRSVATVDDDGRIELLKGFMPNPKIHENFLESLQEALDLAAAAKQRLVDKCLEQIKEDIQSGDVTAIDELLMHLPTNLLKGYLPENLDGK